MKHRTTLAVALCAVSVFTTSAIANKPDTRNRAEIPAEFRWDFTAIYADWAAWEKGLAQMEAQMDAFAKLKGALAGGPAALLKAYQGFDEIGKLSYLVYRYPQLQRDVDTREQAISAHFQRVNTAFAKFNATTAWFTPELLKLPQATVEKWLAETPSLAPYRFSILDNFRQQKHVLDEAGERLLALAGPANRTPQMAYQELSTSDIKFPSITLSDGKSVTLSPANYAGLLESNPSQADRAKAAAAHLGTYGATANTFAALYNGVAQRNWFLAQARSHPSTLAAALDRNHIPTAVVDTLVETTRAGTSPLQRYMRLKQKLLGLKEMHLYDSFVPVVRSDKRYPYTQARDVVLASVTPLGADYVAAYKRFVASGRVDVFENDGKKSGAYVAGVFGIGPYMLLNHNDTLDAMFTLAHEGGHAMHTALSYAAQPYVTSSYTIFVAEVASTTNERFLLEHLLAQTSDPKERFLLLQHSVQAIVNTFYTQVMFADFELQAHRLVEQGKPITAAVLNNIYLGLLKTYYGEALTVDDFYKFTWARIPHFFDTPYYVFQYATCFASSAQLFKDMTTGSEAARKAATERYLTLLKSGGNDHPMAQLQKAGVDLTQRATVQAVVEQMDALVTRMEAEAARLQ